MSVLFNINNEFNTKTLKVLTTYPSIIKDMGDDSDKKVLVITPRVALVNQLTDDLHEYDPSIKIHQIYSGQEKYVDTESDIDTNTEFDTNTESTQDKESPVETITDNKNKPGLKKEIIETVINIDLKEIDQNRYSWNSEIAAKGLKSTIKIINGRKNELKYDVTGKSSFNFNSGDTRFDGVKSKVSLEIEKTDNVKLKGENEIKVTTSCSNKSTK